INFVDAIRFETGNLPSYKLSREIERSLDDATAHRRRRQRPRFDVRSDSAAAIEHSARSGAERRRTRATRLRRCFSRGRLSRLRRLLVVVLVVADVVIVKRTARVIAL